MVRSYLLAFVKMWRGLQPAPRTLTAAQSHPRPPCDVPRTYARSGRGARDRKLAVKPRLPHDRPPQACPAKLPSVRWSRRRKRSCSTFNSSAGSSSCSSTPAAAAAVSSMRASRPTPNGGHRCSRARSEASGRALGAGSADLVRRRCRAAAQAAARISLPATVRGYLRALGCSRAEESWIRCSRHPFSPD